MLRCAQCGTAWFARPFAANPYRRDPTLQAAGRADVSDAIVIEHIAPGFGDHRMQPRQAGRAERRFPADKRWFKGAAAVLGIVAMILVLRVPIVAALPSGLPADADQLAFQRVHSETVDHHGVKTLVVEGEIVNRSGNDVMVPAIRISLHAPEGAEVYSWLVEPVVAGLAPGRSIGFRSAVSAPPANASQVTLRLAQRENQIVGLR
jgi:hypothetical protein